MLKSDLLIKTDGIDISERFWKTSDGLNLYSQTWYPIDKPKAVVHLVHGLGEHSSRYYSWAERLTGEGFIVRSFDLRGHGKSEGRRGYSSNYRRLLRDIDVFIDQASETDSSLPSFIYGHSLGGNLVLNYAIQKSIRATGLIVTSPWLELTAPPSRLKLFAVRILSNILPGLTVKNGLKPEDLSRDLRVVHDYKKDPLVHDCVGIRFFRQTFEAGIRASMSVYKINVPLLVMHGSNDKITSSRASGDFVRNSSDKTTYIEWKGGYHELHNDIDKEKVFASMVSWIDSNI
jgi:alpha-beta hydrolase superfamily lysophospholipase